MTNQKENRVRLVRLGCTKYYPVGFLINLLIIMVFGLLMLFSASYSTGYLRFDDSYHFIGQQMIFAVLGGVFMAVAAQVDYHIFERFTTSIYVLGLLMLVIVLFCEPINDVKRWIHFESGPLKVLPNIQASEIVKFAIILTTAKILTKYRTRRKTFWKGMVLPMLPLVPVLLLLLLEPHLSAMVLMIMIAGSMVVLGGAALRWVVLLGGAAVGIYITFPQQVRSLTDYVATRLDGWTPVFEDMTWQTQQSLLAIGSGGLTGVGIGNSLEKQLWLPECTNDFIFSVLCEELGFFGAMIVILLFVVLIFQLLYISFNAPDVYGTLIGLGVTAQITWQVFFNIAVVTNTVPNTGISLPFFSSGGTSLLLLMAEMGVVINIARQGTRLQLKREQAKRNAPPNQTKEN